jgi:hypothetical protein
MNTRLSKIYKFNIEIQIDFVFTFVDFNDKEYQENLFFYAKETPNILKKKSIFINRYQDFGEIYYAINSVKTFLKFIRKIFIVTPTPKRIYEKYKDDEQVIIVEDREIIKENYITTPNFKSTAIESFLYRIPDLAPFFFYGCDDMFVGRNMERDFFFKKERPLIYLETKTKMVDNKNHYKSPPFLDVYNANKYFQEKFGYFPKKWHNHQICLIRKDVCRITWQIFKLELKLNGENRFREPADNGVHFILLQHLVGLELKLYSRFKKNSIICSGYYDYNREDGGERFRKISALKPHFFCINALDENIINDFKELMTNFTGNHIPN